METEYSKCINKEFGEIKDYLQSQPRYRYVLVLVTNGEGEETAPIYCRDRITGETTVERSTQIIEGTPQDPNACEECG